MYEYTSSTGENGADYFGIVLPKDVVEIIGLDIRVTDKFVDIDTGNVGFTLEYCNCNDPPTVVKTSGSTLIADLNNKGYLTTKKNAEYVTEYIQCQLEQLPTRNVYNNLGWRIKDDKLYFRGHKLLSTDGMEGSYVGKYAIEPRGTKETLIADMHKCILGKPLLELSMILGLSSCVVGYLNCFMSVSSIVANIYGRSTTGKTTCSKLAVSMCGDPSPGIGKLSLASTWYGTENGLFATLSQNCGYTILLDEIGMKSPNLDVVNFIYGVCSGKPKARADKTGGLALRESWATTFISTGEHSMLNDGKPPDGMSVRVLNFGNLDWTESPEQCRELERFTRDHCGLPIELLAEYMLSLNSKDILYRYQQVIDNLIPALKTNESYKDRTAKMVAILILTGELFQECCQVQFSMTAVRDILLDIVEKNTPEAESLRAYEDIRQMVEKNLSKFETKEGDDVTGMTLLHRSHYGFIQYVDVHLCGRRDRSYTPKEAYAVFILRSVFDEWMKMLGYSNVENILHEWRDVYEILMVKDNTRINYHKRISDGITSNKCIALKFPVEGYVTKEVIEQTISESASAVVLDRILSEIESCVSAEYQQRVEAMLTKRPKDFLKKYFQIKIDSEKVEKHLKNVDKRAKQKKNDNL